MICDVNVTTFTLVNVYAPNKHQLHFFHRLMCTSRKHQQGLLLLCGDFNLTPDLAMDFTSTLICKSPAFQQSIHKQDLYNAWRCYHASEKYFTLFSSLILTHQSIPGRLLSRVSSVSINNITWYDYASVRMTIKDPSTVKSNPVWRVNPRLLQQPDIRSELHKLLLNFFVDNEKSVIHLFSEMPIKHT